MEAGAPILKDPLAPLVLTLSDVHWASDEVLELCDRIGTEAAHAHA